MSLWTYSSPRDPDQGRSDSRAPARRNLSSPISLGVRCLLGGTRRDGPWCSLSIAIEEYLILDDGSRIVIRDDRGVSIGWHGDDGPTEAEALESMQGALLPDEGELLDVGESRSWHELSSLLSEQGVVVAPETLKSLPCVTEFSPELRAALAR